jgi:hypothetical protein
MRITRVGLHHRRRQSAGLMGKKRMFGWPTASQMGSAPFLVVGATNCGLISRISSIRPFLSPIGEGRVEVVPPVRFRLTQRTLLTSTNRLS